MLFDGGVFLRAILFALLTSAKIDIIKPNIFTELNVAHVLVHIHYKNRRRHNRR